MLFRRFLFMVCIFFYLMWAAIPDAPIWVLHISGIIAFFVIMGLLLDIHDKLSCMEQGNYTLLDDMEEFDGDEDDPLGLEPEDPEDDE